MANLKDYVILIVDDEEDLRNAMVFDFKRKGFTVLVAENGSTAFEVIKKNKVHLVISDMRMPGGNGMSFLEQVRAYDPTIPTVIFISGFNDYTEEECLKKGARAVLPKPFDRKVLLKAVLDSLGIDIPVKKTG